MTEDQQRALENARPARAAQPLWSDFVESREEVVPAPASTEEFSTWRPAGWPTGNAHSRVKPPPLPESLSDADSRVWMIEQSLGCFYFGCFGLIPGLGLPLAFLALVRFAEVSRRTAGLWNPARLELVGGAWLGLLGSSVSFILLSRLLSHVLRNEFTSLVVFFVPVPLAFWIIMATLTQRARSKFANGAVIGGLWLGVIGALAIVVFLSRVFSKIDGVGTVAFMAISIAVVLAALSIFATLSTHERGSALRSPATHLVWLMILLVLLELIVLGATEIREWQIVPAVLVTMPFVVWALGSVLSRVLNESFAEHQRALLVWLLLAAGFAIQGMIAAVSWPGIALAIALSLPLALAARLAAAIRPPVREACLKSIGLHATWAVISIPFLGAAAHLAGLWDGSVAGFELAKLMRLGW